MVAEVELSAKTCKVSDIRSHFFDTGFESGHSDTSAVLLLYSGGLGRRVAEDRQCVLQGGKSRGGCLAGSPSTSEGEVGSHVAPVVEQ